MSEVKGIIFKWPGTGFGNALLLAQITKIAVDNGIEAVFVEHRKVRGLVDVPLFDPDKDYTGYVVYKGYVPNTPENPNCDIPVMTRYVMAVEEIVGRKLEVREDGYYVPVKFEDIPETPSVDVILCVYTGRWAPYRDWPYFNELQKLLDERNISNINLQANKIFNNECLNYAQRCKLYVGLDTGMTHYVSKFIMGKALIIQSGFGLYSYWSSYYDFDHINHDVPCQPCYLARPWLKKGIVCQRDHECMVTITPEQVLERILSYEQILS
jgi:hypothetical protein